MSRTLAALALSVPLAAGCAASPGTAPGSAPASLGAAPNGQPCRVSGATQSTAILDPIYGTTATPAPAGTPLPTCTPWVTVTPSPGPTPTALPTHVAVRGGGPAIRVSSAPQNLTLSPRDESLGRVALGPAMAAVSWDRSLTVLSGSGTRTIPVSDVLGADASAGVAVSPRGRIHVIGGGRYAYSDDGGGSWSPPVSAPARGEAHLVVDSDGCARAFWRTDGAIRTAKQELDGSWGEETWLGVGGDYDAVRTEEGIVALTTSPGAVHRFPGGWTATLGHASRVDLHYGHGELVAGMARGGDRAVIARSLDGGLTWTECLVQRVAGTVRDVAVVPTEQGPYAALWILDDGDFPSVILSRVHWKVGVQCGVWPEPGQVDELERAPFIAAPRLFGIGCAQTSFRVASQAGSALMAFTCLDDGGSADIFVSRLSASGFFSGPAQGGARAGEGASRDDYLGELP